VPTWPSSTPFPQGSPVRDFGYYATELRGSVPLSDQGDAGTIAIGTNVVEFHPAAEDRAPQGHELLRVEQLEVGQRYFVYVTNTSGLYRYEMNDIVEVTGHNHQTPLIRFIQKGKGVVSFTGGKLYEARSSPPSTRRWRRCEAATTSSPPWPSWWTPPTPGWSS
jgi:hypothetical protein